MGDQIKNYVRGDIVVRNGQLLRFVESEIEGDVWEILGESTADPETVAKALWRGIGHGCSWEELPYNVRQGHIATARRAIHIAKTNIETADALMQAAIATKGEE